MACCLKGGKNTIQEYWGLAAVVLPAGDSMVFLDQQTTVFVRHENNCNVGWAYGPRVGLLIYLGAPEILSPLEFFVSLFPGCVYTIY